MRFLDVAGRRLSYTPGRTLLEILEEADIPLVVGCAGDGTCRLCRVRVDDGDAAEEVLACQHIPTADLRVEVPQIATRSLWAPFSLDCPRPLTGAGDGGVVAALDLGTTRISVAVAHAATGEIRGAWEVLNPQRRYGADVVSRLSAALTPETRERLRDGPRRLVKALVAPLGVRRLRVVGNSAMITLLLDDDAQRLLDPDRWAAPRPAARLGAEVLGAPAELPAGCGGFVGSDLVAAAVAVGLIEGGPALLVDLGTNTEIMLWDGRRAWTASAAGGPALEVVGIAAAGPADEGIGLCGSDLVAEVAALLRAGQLRRDGRLTGSGGRLLPRDIHMVARAKAAVGAAIEHLQQLAGAAPTSLWLCGRFGASLDVEAAVALGLLPSVDTVCVAPHAALTGALAAVLSSECEETWQRCRAAVRHVDLSVDAGYEARFVRHLFFPA